MLKPTDPLPERLPELELSLGELEQLERNRERAAACATHWRLWWRLEHGGSVPREELLVVPRRCGLRSCPNCGARLRARHQGRTRHGWQSLILLTVPHRGRDAAEAWRKIHAQLARFIRLFRRAHKDGMVGDKSAPFAYAWALEHHRDGFPHIHVVSTVTGLTWESLRSLWKESAGEWCYVGVETVRDETSACDYLSKYIAKGVTLERILAILYRRRLWARSRGVGPALEANSGEWTDLGPAAAYERELGDAAENGWDAAWAAQSGARLLWRYSDGRGSWQGDVQSGREDDLRRASLPGEGMPADARADGWLPPWRSGTAPVPPISRLVGLPVDRQRPLFAVVGRDETEWR